MRPSGTGPFCYDNHFRGLIALLLAALTLFCDRDVVAQPLAERDVPGELKPWIPWVLDSVGEAVCPQIGDAHVCSWPGLLRLELNDQGGRFSLSVEVDQTSEVQLPGSAAVWPQEVHFGGQRALVFEDRGIPRVSLSVGTHTLEGRFLWNALPESLKIPGNVGLVSLRVNGIQVDYPKRDPQLLWLKAKSDTAGKPESLSVEVFRRLEDGVPFKVTTQLVLQVSGRAREIALGKVLLAGGEAVAVSSGLPTSFAGDSELSIQVFAGKHLVTLVAMYATPPESLGPERWDAPWPESEIWAFKPDPQLRQVDVEGAPAIDPQHTNLPKEWKNLSAYRVGREQKLTLSTARRGEPESPPNALNLDRDVWLDLDGKSFTVRDRISGRMNRDWRIDLTRGQLGFAKLSGEPQLITQSADGKFGGVELREGTVDLLAEWRVAANARAFPAVGWSQDVQHLSTRLHVPPGWQLLTASGVDQLGDTWLSSWDLFTLFFVLIVSLATAKLTHPVWGLLALVTLTVTHDQEHAPYALWLALLTVVALLKLRPKGLVRRTVQLAAWLTAAALAFCIVQFCVQQVRTALYPQAMDSIDRDDSFVLVSKEGGSGAEYRASMRKVSAPMEQTEVAAKDVQQLQDPAAVIQTGSGIPDWSWHTWSLDWSGPVHRAHSVHLYLLSPTGNAVLSFLRILLCGLFGFLLLRFAVELTRGPPPTEDSPASGPPLSSTRTVASALMLWVASVLAFSTILGSTSIARAEAPSADLLKELETRLLRKPPCSPNCISVDKVELKIDRRELSLRADINAAGLESYQLPGPLENWTPQDVRINGHPAAGMILRDDGFLHLRLPPGTHRVDLRGPVDNSDLTLLLGTKPHLVSVSADGWSVDGLSEEGQVDGSLQFRREASSKDLAAKSDSEGAARQLLPSWLRVTRTLQFGVDWTVRTEVERLSPVGSPVLVRLPLLNGERVTQADLLVDQQVATLSLGRKQTRLQFDSVLSPQASVKLVAQAGQRYNERWVVQCGPMWRCEATGLAPVRHQSGGKWQPDFLPWPGEELTLTINRPVPAEGSSVTVDNATLTLTPGVRLMKANLALSVRNSAQGLFIIDAPLGSEVQDLMVNGESQPFQRLDSNIAFNLSPGEHNVALNWQQNGGMKSVFTGAKVSLNHELVNARVTIEIPRERWLLFARGPGWGPAILFWGYLIFILLLAPVLGRLSGSPLRTWQWAILVLGLTQVPIIVSAIVVAWFFVVAHVNKWRPRTPRWHNFCQLLLVLGTVVFLGCLFGAVYDGLLSSPNMEVVGQNSTDERLTWYVDRSNGSLPVPQVFTASLWLWRLTMLAWALWLATNLLRWLRWAWTEFSSDGTWKSSPKPPQTPRRGGSASGGGPVMAYTGGHATTPENPASVPAPTPLGASSHASGYSHFQATNSPQPDYATYSQRPTSEFPANVESRRRSEPPPKPQVVVGRGTLRPTAPEPPDESSESAPVTPRDPSVGVVRQSGLTERPAAIAASLEPAASELTRVEEAAADTTEGVNDAAEGAKDAAGPVSQDDAERPTIPLEDMLKEKREEEDTDEDS